MSYTGFTYQADGLLKKIVTPIRVRVASKLSKQESSWTENEIPALWDTGATGSMITASVASQCALRPIGVTEVGSVSDKIQAPFYFADFLLPNNVIITDVKVVEGLNHQSEIGALIGMDIICLGDFALTHVDKKSVFTFRVPAFGKIDFVEEHNRINKSMSGKKKQSHRSKKKQRRR